jgi:trigger factor
MIVEKLDKNRVKLVFDVTADEFEKALDKAFERENAKVTIKGFRKGHAPRSVFEKTYGVEALFESALNVVLASKFQEAIQDEAAKNFLGRPEAGLEEKIERGKDFKVSLTWDVYPEVTLPNYKGVEVKAKNLKVTAKEVDKAIKAFTKKDAVKETKTEQVIAKNDYAAFDFVGTVDGVEFLGGKAENYDLQIGSGQFIPGFEDQMIGLKAGETKDLKVTFPKDYLEATLAGMAAVFKVTVHEVTVEKFPRLTDEYIAGLKLEGVTTTEELKASKKAELEAKKATEEKDRQLNDIINYVLYNAKVDLPKTLVDEKVNQLKSQYEQQAKMYNIPFETFLGFMGTNLEAFNENMEKQGARQALFQVVAQKIIEVEKLTQSQEALEAKAEEEAKFHNSTKDKMLKTNVAKYYSDLAYKSLVDLLIDNAKEI